MRRRFKSKTGVPVTKTTEDIARNRGFQKPSAKRVRFDDAETNASVRGDEATQSPKSGGGPKTSEYAYFRKVKEGAVNGHSRALHKENEHLKSSKLSYLHRDTNKAAEKLDPGIKDLEFCTSGESAGPSGRKLFVSPPVRIFDESNEISRKELAYKTKQRSPLLPETATPVRQSLLSSPLNQTTEKSENICIEKGFFSEKRKKLRQWVAHTTSSEVEKLHEKGSDLVSFLLCRLIPKGNENNDSSKENATNSSALTVHQSDNVEKGLSLPDKRDCHKELPKISSERSSEIVPREWDTFECGFPSDYQNDCDLRKNMDHCRRPSEIVLGERDSFECRFPSNYHEDGELRGNINHSRRSSKSVLKEWDNFDSISPADGELRNSVDHSGRSNEIVLREWDSFESAFSSNYHKDGELQRNMDHSGRSSESVPREWDSFESGFPCYYQKDGELRKYMDHLGRSNEIVLRECDNPHSRFPSNYHKESKLQNKSMHPYQHSKSRMYNRSYTHPGFLFCLPFERLRSLDAFQFKDLDEFCPVVEHVREEPCRNSLEWVFESGKDRPDHDTRQAMCHRPPNAWDPDQQGVLDNMLNANGFPASPLFSRRSLVKPLPEYVRTACLMDEDQPEFDDVKFETVEPRQLPLSFPYSPKCIPLAEDRYPENNVSNGNIILSYRELRRPNKVWDCTPHSDSGRNCLAASELSAEDHQSRYHAWQFPQNEKGSYSLALLKASPEESFASPYEGASDHYLLPSALHSPLDTFMDCPLLLNGDQVLYSDDYDNQLG